MRSKSSRAALLAQQLGSSDPWANTFVPDTQDALANLGGSLPNEADGLSNELPPAYEDIAGAGARDVLPVSLDTKATPAADLQTNRDIGDAITVNSLEEDAKVDPLRSHVRHENYASITGTYTFFDYLELVCTHGSIDIVLDPQPGNKPCFLKLESLSGSIRVALSEEYTSCLTGVKDDEDRIAAARTAGNIVCCRPWIVSVRSKHGSVECKLPLGMGSRHFLKSRLGSVRATFYATPAFILSPEIFGEQQHGERRGLAKIPKEFVQIRAETHRGSQDITVVSPSFPTRSRNDITGKYPELQSPVIDNIVSDYWVKSHGSLKVHYPNTWRGRVEAKTKGGEAKIEGSGFNLQHFGKREVHGSRGEMGEGYLTRLRCDGGGSAKIEC